MINVVKVLANLFVTSTESLTDSYQIIFFKINNTIYGIRTEYDRAVEISVTQQSGYSPLKEEDIDFVMCTLLEDFTFEEEIFYILQREILNQNKGFHVGFGADASKQDTIYTITLNFYIDLPDTFEYITLQREILNQRG